MNQTHGQLATNDIQLYTTKLVDIDKPEPAEYNPRTIEEDRLVALMNSLDQDPEYMKVRPIVVNMYGGREWLVIAGNKRLKAAKELGWSKIPAMFVKVPKNKEKKWNLKDNINQGEWDRPKVQEILIELRDEGELMTDIGLTPEETIDYIESDIGELDPTDNPEYQGTTPSSKKAGVRQAVEVECPECGATFHTGQSSPVEK